MASALTWVDLVTLGGLAVVISATIFAVSILIERRATGQKPPPRAAPSPSYRFDFDSRGCFDYACANGERLLQDMDLPAPGWSRFRAAMANRFADLPGGIAAVDRSRLSTHAAFSIADPMVLDLEHHSKGLTVQMRAGPPAAAEQAAQRHDVFCSLASLDTIRAASENAPYPVWQTLRGGRIGWSNAAYRELDTQIVRSTSLVGAPLFQLSETGANDTAKRVQIKDRDRNRVYWFDVTSRKFGDGHVHFAIDVHAVVNAEAAQRNFVQTLAKTFAQLATGLAIFDRNRQLVLFNPALIDLTSLPADFLSARPNLFSFFDQLRNNNIMPEPKSYANWRERIADVVSAASDGNFTETWHLPSGVTYRITGRPHPDGAIAFLIEDISAEISLTRRFRSEVEVTQSALDALSDCVAIFAATGALIHVNHAMKRFVADTALNSPNDVSILDMTRFWQGKCHPNPVWGDIREFVAGCTEREIWSAELVSLEGRLLEAHIAPLTAGATLVTFRWRIQQPKAAKPRTKPAKRVHTAVA